MYICISTTVVIRKMQHMCNEKGKHHVTAVVGSWPLQGINGFSKT